jgi:hypothetical protein
MKTKTYKVKLVDVKIPEYWIETAYDYHEFKSIVYRLNKIGINRKIKYVELGFYNGVYNAVFWIGKKPTDFILENSIEN